MQLKGKKIRILSTIVVYCATFFMQSNLVFFETWAKESNKPRVNIVAILVDNEIYSGISGGLSRYGTEYIQKKLSDTRALIMPIDVSKVSAYDIYRMMENVYFDGLEDVNSSLIGLIMFGDIPLPVANQDGYVFPTVYPYVDFENQKYVWDPITQYFVPNGNPEGQAEIWHGLVNYGLDIESYSKFFEKIHKYVEEPEEFIGNSLWYEDIIASKEGFLNENFKYYRNKIMYGEDISYQRYSPLMKKLFADESSDDSSEIIEDLAGAMEELDGNIEDVFGDVDMGEAMGALKSSGNIPSTKMIQQEIQTSLLADYEELFSKNNLSLMRENVFAGGRWIKTYENGSGEKSQIVDSDSSASMIQLKDTMYLGNDNLQGLFENLNELMEKMIDEKIENEKYSMDIVVPISYKKITGKRIDFKCHSLVERWENYYFGKNARYITEAEDLSLYRGTYRNLSNINGLTYDDLLTGNNPVKSVQDKTDVKLKSIGASYDIFSSQAEGNRGFLMTAVDQDLETWEVNKVSEKGKVGFWETLSLSSVKRRKWPEKCKESKCEKIHPFAQRRWGGASPINLITESVGSGKYQISGYIADSSWRSIYDMGGFQSLQSGADEGMNGTGWIDGLGVGPQTAATSFKSYIKYSSPTQREGWDRERGITRIILPPYIVYKPNFYIYENHTPDVHTGFKYLDYWNLKNTKEGSLAFNLGKFNTGGSDTFTIDYSEPNRILACSSSWNYTYKVMSSIVKHDSTTEDEINGIYYDKYGKNGSLGSYYSDLMAAYGDIDNDMSDVLSTFPGLIDLINSSTNYITGKIASLHGEGDDLEQTQIARGNLESQRNSEQSRLNGYESELQGMRSESDVEADLSAAYAALGALEDGEDDSSIRSTIRDLQDELDAIQSLKGKIETSKGIISGLNGQIKDKQNHEHQDEQTIEGLLREVSSRIAQENKEMAEIYKLVEGLFPENITSVLEYMIGAEGGNPMDYYEGDANGTGVLKIGFLPKWMTSIDEIHTKVLNNRQAIVENYLTMYKLIEYQQGKWNDLAEKLNKISKENGANIDRVSGEMNDIFKVVDDTKWESDGGASLSEEEKKYSEQDPEPVVLERGTASDAMNKFSSGLQSARELYSKLVVRDLTGMEVAMHARVDADFHKWLDKKSIDYSKYEDEDRITQFAIWAGGDGQDNEWVRDLKNQEKLEGVVIHMAGLNILTPDRPIDSPRYVSMQSIAGNEIKLIYPNLFKVEVFELTGKNKSGYDIHALLTGGQIKDKLIEYLTGKVEEYNKILENEYNSALADNDYFKKLFNNSYPLATPTKYKNIRPYNPFTLDDFVEALGGSGMLDVISDMLYYQSITNKKKLSTGDVSEDISLIKTSFNINDKREQTLEDYLVEENEKIKNPLLVIPTYELSGYEVAYINSDGKDYIIPIEEAEEIKGLTKQSNKNIRRNEQEQPQKEEEQLNDACGIPDDGVLPLFKLENLKITSPWWDGFKCWVNHLKDSVKIKFTFHDTLGQVHIASGLIEFVDTAELSGLKVALKDSISETSRGNAMTQYADERESILKPGTGFNADMDMTQIEVEAEKHNREVMGGDSGTARALSNFYKYIKFSNSNARLSDNNLYSELKIGATTDVGTISVNFVSTGDSCLALDGHGLCGGYTVTFNPKTNPFTGYISSADHKAGSSALIIKVSLGGDYIEKVIKYNISPSLLERAEIKVKDDKTIAGMISPVEVIGYDKYNNKVSWGLEKYNFTVSQGRFLKDGAYQDSFTTNDFRNLNFYYQAPLDAVDGSMAIIQIAKATDSISKDVKYLGTYQQPVAQAKPEVKLNSVLILKGDQLVTNQTYRLSNNEDIYLGGSLNVGKLQKLEVDMKDARGNLVDVDSQIVVTSQNGLVVVGQVQDEGTGGLRFMETSRNYMSGGHAVIYYYPTTVAGSDIINIDIPGLDTRVIKLGILPGQLSNVQISLEKDVLELGDEMDVELFLSDVWGNLINYPEVVTLLFDEEKIEFVEYPGAEDSIDVAVTDGYRSLPIIGTGAGLTYLIVGNSYVPLTVDKHIFPESGLNIMYLNYFGNDRGNQWGYFSDNKKHVELLMTQSNKIITTTTQLVSEDKIKKMTWKIQPGFKIWNPDNLDISMTIQNGIYKMIVGGITTMTQGLPSFSPVVATQDTVENILNSSRASGNLVFFVPNDVKYTLSGGVLYDSGVYVGNILNSEITLQLSKYNMSNGDNIWSVTNKGVNYGTLIMHYPDFKPREESFSLPGSRYSVNYTFTNGSTDKLSSVGIFDMQSNFELESSYESIQDSNKIDEQIGFLGDFKNITLFAQGEIVGEATKKFGSELLINLGDPVLSTKPTNENEKVYGTEYEGGIGNEIFVDSEKDIFVTYQIDFNNDGNKDLLVVYKDGVIKLSKSYGGNPDLRNMQELMRIAVPIKEVYVGDADGNGYQDILILTKNDQIRAYLNRGGIFDVDGNVACLNLNVRSGEISTTPSDISEIYQIFIEDMDVDGVTDIITYDHKGFVKIFFGGNKAGKPNYLSTEKYACDDGWYLRESSNTKTLTAYGLKVTNERVFDNSMLHRQGMVNEPIEITEDELPEYGMTMSINTGYLESLVKPRKKGEKGSADGLIHEIMDKFDTSKAVKKFQDESIKFQEVTLYENKLVDGGSSKNYLFAPISYLSPDCGEDIGSAWKNYSLKSGSPILQNGDKVTVTVTVKASDQAPFMGAFGDVIEGPWNLYYDEDNILKGIKFLSNKGNAVVKKRDGNFAYIIDNIVLAPGQTMVYQYELEYHGVQLKNLSLSYETFWSDDELPDIKEQCMDGCTKDFGAFVNGGGRSFGHVQIPLQEMIEDTYKSDEEATEDFGQEVIDIAGDTTKMPGIVENSIERIRLIQSSDDFSSMEITNDEIGKKELKNAIMKKIEEEGLEALNMNFNINLSIFEEQTDKIEDIVDDITEGMCNGFQFGGSNNCKGLPVPFNQAFLAPGKYHLFGCRELPLKPLEGGVPAFFFPGTFYAPPAGEPIPMPRGLKDDSADDHLWASGGSPTYPSLIRIYLAPTLTAQLGVAICLGPYATSHLFPSPLGDVAGNCVVFAIKPQCKNDGGEKQDPENPNETYEKFTEEVRDSGTCSQTQKGPTVTEKGERSSAYDLYSYNSTFRDLKLTDNDIETLLVDLERKYPTTSGRLTTEEKNKYNHTSRMAWRDGNGVDNEKMNYGSVWEKIWKEYMEETVKMSVDMQALGMNIITLGLFRHVLGEEYVDSLYGNIDRLYSKYFSEAKLTPATDLGYGYTEYSSSFMGIIDIETQAYIGNEEMDDNTKNSITIGNIDILGGDYDVNKIRGGLQQGLKEMLIDKWLDPQIRYILNQLTKMHVLVKLPQMSNMVQNEISVINNVSSGFNDLWSGFGEVTPTIEDSQKPVLNRNNDGGKSTSTWSNISQENLYSLNKTLANPFEGLASLMNQSNIMNISTRKLTVKVPMIFAEDISSYSIYLQEWIDVNEDILKKWDDALNSLFGSCSKITGAKEQQACYDRAREYLNSLDDFKRNEWQRMLDDIYTNILILQEYRDFPFEIYEWIHVVDRYTSEITSLVNNTIGYLSYWININANRFVGYVDAIVLAWNIIKTYQLIIDFSVNWSKSCGNCASDTYDQYSCKLSILCKAVKLPILQIPNFKIPNITLDLTNINLGLDIVLPEFNFQPVNIELPNLINLPEPPMVGANIKLLDLPEIPQLPEPPDLPELPSFIPEVEMELPVLPPAPELPKLPNKIEGIIKFANIVGKIYCIVKGSFGLVGEKSVKAKIEQITQRTYKVDWIDNIMDFTNWSAAPVKNYGVDYEISSYVDMQFNFTDFYDYLDVLTTSINNLTTTIANVAQEKVNSTVDNDLIDGVNNVFHDIDGRDIQINGTLIDLDKKNGSDGIIGYNNGDFNGITSEELEYVDYESAKSRLQDVLTYFRTEANESSFKDSINSSITKIENWIDSPNNLKPNEEGIEEVKNEALAYIRSYQSGYEDLANLINNDYDGFLAMVNAKYNADSTGDSEKLLTFNVNLFDLDSATKDSIKALNNSNPYELLLDNKQTIIDGYWNAINTNTADSLGLTPAQYVVLRNNIYNMRQQVATLYRVIKPVSTTQLVAKNGSTSSKTLLAGKRMGSNYETSNQVDPSAFSQGIYELMTEGDQAGERLAKVVYSDSFASLIRDRYFHTTHTVGHDIILWTEDAVFKKCSGGSCVEKGREDPGSYHCSTITDIPYVEKWISCGGSKLKIADGDEEVKNRKVKGQTYDNLSFSWTLNTKVDGYLIKLVERIDHSYEKADFEGSVPTSYVLALPKGTDLSKLYEDKVKLELIKKTNYIEKLLGNDLVEIVYYDNTKELTNIIISNIERKWHYGRISTLDLVGDTYHINSPWSNQIVAGKQAVGDDQPPLAKQYLNRPSIPELTSEGDDLEGYVGTKYSLDIVWTDNVALSYISVSQSGTVLDEKYTSKPEDTLSVDIDMHFKNEQESYDLLGIDQFGNKTEKTITVTYLIPEISITDIKDNGNDTVAIIAELSQDIDQGNVSFQRRRGNVWKTMKKKDIECADMPIGPGIQTVIGTPYSKGTDIAMYDKGGGVMALMNPDTAEINILSGYDKIYDVKVFVQNSSVLQVYNTGSNETMFSISIPTEECLKVEAENYTVVDLPEIGKMGMFNGGKAVYKDGTIMLVISPTGHLYSEYGLEGEYDYDREVGAVTLTLYQLSDLDKNNPIKVWLKVEPFLGS